MMTRTEQIRIWLCDCGYIHFESNHCRQSCAPAEFLTWLRNLAGPGGAPPAPPSAIPSLPKTACDQEEARRAIRLSTVAESES